MKIGFDNLAPNAAVDKLKDNLSGRKLGSIVSFDLESETLTVVISKLGTSKLIFSVDDSSGNTVFDLTKEKIAFSHRALKDGVIQKLAKVIRDCDGDVLREYGA
jgi:hypothetical protein